MKKKLQVGLLILVMGLSLTGCCLSHEWKDADCVVAKTCAKCGETEGEALGHVWKEADCTTAKTCSTCGETEGTALGHAWKEADCTTAKTCNTCGVTEGEALGHAWVEATLDTAKTCSTCAVTEGTPNKEAVTVAAESFLKAIDEVDREAIESSCMGFVLIDMGMAQLSIEAVEDTFYTAVGIDKAILNEDAQAAVTEYGNFCAEGAVQGYSVDTVTEINGVITVTATIKTFSPEAENPMESEALMSELEDMADEYVEDNMLRLLDVYFDKGEEAVTMQIYNDLIPTILEMCQEAIAEVPVDDIEVVFNMEKIGDKWMVTRVVHREGEGDFLL